MTKTKACIITAIASTLLFCVLYLSSSYAIRWYQTFQSIFAAYGYIQAIVILYKWLREPSYEVDPRHVDIDVASGKTIPSSWLNPFKTVKEANNGRSKSYLAKGDGLSNAGNKNPGAVSVSGRTVDSVRAGHGDSSGEQNAENSPAAG